MKEVETYDVLHEQVTDRGPWQQTWSGRAFYPADPRPEEVTIVDIAGALSNINRYCGHTVTPISVARHALNISYWMEEDGHPLDACLFGLHHDSDEAYTSDIPTQIKWLVPELKERTAPIFQAIVQAFHLNEAWKPTVKSYDFIALATEVKWLLGENLSDQTWGDLPPPRSEDWVFFRECVNISSEKTADEFMQRHHDLLWGIG